MSTQERMKALNAEMTACGEIVKDSSATEAQKIAAMSRIQEISKELGAAYRTLGDEFIAHVHEVNDAFISDLHKGVIPQ